MIITFFLSSNAFGTGQKEICATLHPHDEGRSTSFLAILCFMFGQQHNYFEFLTQNSFQKTVKNSDNVCRFFQALPRKLFKNIKLGRSSDLLHRFAAFPSLRTVAGGGNDFGGAYSSGTVRDLHPIPF